MSGSSEKNQGRFLLPSECAAVPYIVAKISSRSFRRCMGSWGCDLISSSDELRKIICCNRGVTAVAADDLRRFVVLSFARSIENPYIFGTAATRSFCLYPVLMGDSQHAGNAARIFSMLPVAVSGSLYQILFEQLRPLRYPETLAWS